MAITPVNFTAKNAKKACEQLNDLVDRGVFNFTHVGIVTEKVVTISKNSDGTTSRSEEPVWRFAGLAESVENDELVKLNEWKAKNEAAKKEREVLDRRMNLLNGKPFGPLSIFLCVVGIICAALGILTVSRVLPIPDEQNVIAIILIVVGVIAIGLCVLATVIRSKKIKGIQSDRSSIEESNRELAEREANLKGEEPSWHASSIFQYKDNIVYNSQSTFELVDKR